MNNRMIAFCLPIFIVLFAFPLVLDVCASENSQQPFSIKNDFHQSDFPWSFCSENIQIHSAEMMTNFAQITILLSNDPESLGLAYSLYRFEYCAENEAKVLYSGNVVFEDHQFLPLDTFPQDEEWHRYRIIDKTIANNFVRYEITVNGNVCDFIYADDHLVLPQCKDLGLDLNLVQDKRDVSFETDSQVEQVQGCGTTTGRPPVFIANIILLVSMLFFFGLAKNFGKSR